MSEIALLAALAERDNYFRFKKYIKKHTLTDITSCIVSDLNAYYDRYSCDEVDWSEFASWFKTVQHPSWKPDKMEPYATVIETLEDYEPTEVAEDIVNSFVALDYATRIMDIATHLVDQDGKHTIADIADVLTKYSDESDVSESETLGEVHLSLEELMEKTVTGEGYEWKLPDLNVSFGTIRLGDMVGFVARPEVGKTTMVIAEATHILSQMETSTCLVCNNEESSEKLQLRSYQAALGKDAREILSDVPKSEADYKTYLNGNRFIVWKPDNGYMDKRAVEAKIRQHNPKIIIFNVLDKVHGFGGGSGNEVQAGRERAQWARELASQGRIVFIVLQADASAEGVKYLNQSQIYGSKTGVQGETDALLMIGKSEDPSEEPYRYFQVTRNKLVGGGSMWDRNKKYLRSEVEFKPQSAQYTTTEYKK